MLRRVQTSPLELPAFNGPSAYRAGPSIQDVAFRGAELARGHSGEGVRAMQALLNALGANPPLDQDGLFGPKTEAALRGFQAGLGVRGSDGDKGGGGGGDRASGRCGVDSLLPMLLMAGIGGDKSAPSFSPAPSRSFSPAPSLSTAPSLSLSPELSRRGPRAPMFDRGPSVSSGSSGPSAPSLRAGELEQRDTLRRNLSRAPSQPGPRTSTNGANNPGDLSHMVDWARAQVGKPYVYGYNDCVTMCRDYIKANGLKPGRGSNNHDILPASLQFMGGFDASGGKLREMPGIGKDHQNIAVGSIFGIGELCNQSDCRALGTAPDGTKFNTLFSCSHSGIITHIKREGNRPDGRIVDFGFAEMHGTVSGRGACPGMTFHDSYVEWANKPRSKASQFQHAFVYQPPGTSPATNTPPRQESSPAPQGSMLAAEQRKQVIDAVWKREANGTFKGLVEWDPTENFPSLGVFHTTWDNPAHPGEGGGGNSFYSFLQHAQRNGMPLPPEVLNANGSIREAAPWSSKAAMDADPTRVHALRTWLARSDVQDMQLAFTESRLAKMASTLSPRAQSAYQNIVAGGGTDLMIDLVNFKGPGAVRGMLERYSFPANVRKGVADAAWSTLQATRSNEHLALYGNGWKSRLDGYWRG